MLSIMTLFSGTYIIRPDLVALNDVDAKLDLAVTGLYLDLLELYYATPLVPRSHLTFHSEPSVCFTHANGT